MKLEIEITTQDYVDFTVYHFTKTRLSRTVVTCFLGLIILQFALNKDKSNIDVSRIVVSLLLYIGIYCLFLYYSLNRSRKIPDDNGSLLGKKEFELSADHISYIDRDSAGQYKWTAIKSLEESKSAFYLYIDANMAIVMPKRYFKDKAEEKEFSTYIQDKLTVA